MKQYIIKGIAAAGVVLFTVPSFAQQNEKDKEKSESKERQTIIINRSGDSEEETVIRIKGDKVTVNGKDAKDAKDVSVNVHKFKDWNALSSTITHGGNWNVMDGDVSLFTEDANRAMLGVITDDDSKGAIISSITKESAAEKAGLKKGDVITRIGDKKISDHEDIASVIRSHKPGDKVTITYLREGKEQKTTAELQKWKGIKVNTNAMVLPKIPQPPAAGTFYYNTGRPKLGISIQDTEDGKGVKVLEVEADGAGAKAGLKKDDIITHVDDNEVKSTDDVKRNITRSTQQFTYNFKVLRNGKTQTVEVKLPRKLKTADL